MRNQPSYNDQNSENQRYYRFLTRNMVLTIILISLIPYVIVTAILLQQFRTSHREKVIAHLEGLVKKHKQNIDAFLKEKLGNLNFLARTFHYEELSSETFLKDRLEMLQQVYGPFYVDLGVISSRGIQISYAGPFRLVKASYGDADWFRKAMERETYISDVFSGLRGLPHFIVAVRENWMGEPWILRGTIDFVAFNDLVEHIRIGQTGFAFIINREGELQTKPSYPVDPSHEPYAEILRKEDGKEDRVRSFESTDNSGVTHIYVTAFLKGGDWLLVYQQKLSDAFSDFERALHTTILVLVLGLLVILTTAVLLSRRMVGRIARADQEKHMMNEQVVETGKLASVGELAAGIAHEINNPVAIMVEEAGWIEDLLEDEDFKEGENLREFKRALAQIRTQGKRCKEITHKLLSFARKTDERVQEVNINEVIREIVTLSAQRAKYSNVNIQADLADPLPRVRLSQAELQQVLLNLINNALDAMEKSGGSLEIRSGEAEGTLWIEVADTGPGIPAANLARIFDPFFTTKPVGKGTGLGLSICYGIVKKLGGEIEVASTVGVGTTFRIKMPLEKIKSSIPGNEKGE